MRITYTDIKKIYESHGKHTINEMLKVIGREWAEDLLTKLGSINPDDFEINDYRIISYEVIDGIQCEELEDNPYILGNFDAYFLASLLNVDLELITVAQANEAYEALGNSIIKGGHIQELQEFYSRTDGYGHHFAGYDHEEHDCGKYAVFRLN